MQPPPTPSLSDLSKAAPIQKVSLSYLSPLPRYKDEKPYAIEFEIPLSDESHRSNFDFSPQNVPLHDLRQHKKEIKIEKHGFEVIDISDEILERWFEGGEQREEMEGVGRVLKKRFETEEVFCFTHRHRQAEKFDGDNVFRVQQHKDYSYPVNNPHADFTPESGLARLRRHLTEEEYTKYTNGTYRIRIINFWKPTHHKISNNPLIFCDNTTISKTEMIPCDIISPAYIGGFSFVHYDEKHKWYWTSEQDINEAFIFTSWDSLGKEGGDSPFTFHASCEVEDGGLEGMKRRSMEVRAIVITRIGGGEDGGGG